MLAAARVRALAMSTPLPATTETIAMSDPTIEEKIRVRAYELWQQDGCLEGCADEYWHMVSNELKLVRICH
ncbi:DUF2934 domain-containing protein [Paraburkholderia domus]|nr:DUF2934 domain-containing protein [Paraburkholderia domus]